MRLICLALGMLWGLGAHAATRVAPAAYPEGPLYWRGAFYYTEMGADQVVSLVNGKPKVFWREKNCGPTSLAPYRDGLLVLCHLTGSLVALDAEGRVKTRYLRATDGTPLQNPNDSFADDYGGVFFTDPGAFSKTAPATGLVYRLSPEGEVRRLAGPLHYPNGVYYDVPARRLYVSEHLRRRVLAFDVSREFRLGPPSVHFSVDAIAPPPRTPFYQEAGPDGLEKAPNGDLVVAIYGEGRFLQVTPQGALRRQVLIPPRFVTNIAFAPSGDVIGVGSFINDKPPFTGGVFRYGRGAFGS